MKSVPLPNFYRSSLKKKKKKSLRHRLTVVFIIAEFLDLLTTAIAVYGLGMGEMNPLTNFVPLWALMIFKVLIVSGIAAYLFRSTKMYLWVYMYACGFTIGVVLFNTAGIMAALLEAL